MQNNIERAKIFMPFDALKGLKEAYELQEKIAENKIELGEDRELELNKKISSLVKGDNVTIKYYYGIEYIETSGIVKKVDDINKNIQLLSTKIDFDDILDIEIN